MPKFAISLYYKQKQTKKNTCTIIGQINYFIPLRKISQDSSMLQNRTSLYYFLLGILFLFFFFFPVLGTSLYIIHLGKRPHTIPLPSINILCIFSYSHHHRMIEKLLTVQYTQLPLNMSSHFVVFFLLMQQPRLTCQLRPFACPIWKVQQIAYRMQ